jgi:hypothetical protein
VAADAMTFFLHFGNTYDSYEHLMSPLEDLLRVEAADPKSAVEQLLRDGERPDDHRFRCVTVISAVQNRRARGSQFWINFEGEPMHLRDLIFC